MFVYLHVKFQDKKIVNIAELAGHSQHIVQTQYFNNFI